MPKIEIKLFNILFTFLVFSFLSHLFSDEAIIEFGGQKGWKQLSSIENVTYTQGLYGFESLELLASPEKSNESYDLFLSFDGDTSKDYLKLYDVVSSKAIYVKKDKAKYGTGALLCRANAKQPSMILSPKNNSFFFGESKVNSFTIEFWLCPEDLRAGSNILKWWSQILEKKVFMFQNIIVSVVDNRLEWSFFNIWRDNNSKGIDIKVRSNKQLPLEKWTHHLLTFDDETGLLEYRINGKVDSIRYLTPSSKETNKIFYSMKGKTSQLLIGEGYSGLIDNLVVKNSFSPQGFQEAIEKGERYNKDGGRVVSHIIDTGGVNSMPKMLNARMDIEKEASVAFFIRTSNSPYNWTQSYPAWKAVSKNEAIFNCQPGRFFQIAFNMYPTKDGKTSPIIHSLKLDYERDTFAKPPIDLVAKEGDGYVDLSWSRSIDFDVKGYLVFFGDREGQYLLPSSPIDAKDSLSIRIYNLENGKLYFFSVAAYDENGKLNPGEFSKEVWIRPMQRK
ncbi:MAG: LamG-like jellyroll fold domain-containing protein [Treponema sp.]